MKKLDRFILKAFIGPFVAILFVVVFILMMQTLWLYIDELVGKGLGIRTILEFLFWGVCSLALPLALPLATLLAATMTIGQLSENSELMAIKASGISFGRLIAPLAVAAALIAAGTYIVCSNLVPYAYNQIYTLRDDIAKTKDEIKIPPGTFYDGIDGYILRVDDQNKETKMLYGVQVYDHTAHKGNISVTIADSAVLKMSKGKDYLTFSLYNGSTYREDNTLRYNDTSLVLQHIDFARQELLIPLKNYSFEKSDSARFDDQVKTKQSRELRHLSDSLRHELDSLHKMHYEQIRRSPTLQQAKQLDTALRNPDRQYFSHPDFLIWKGRQEEVQAWSKAADNAMKLSGEINNIRFESYDRSYILRQSDLSFLEKFAQGLACFLLFFIGAPMGALVKSKRGGLGVGLIISVLFFVLYYVVNISGTKLARDGAVETPIGVFISAAVIAPLGAFFTWKALKDSDLFNMDQFKIWRRKILSKIQRLFRPVRIVYMGTPEFAVKPLDTLIQAGFKVVGVVTVADKPSGRGLKVNESAVKQYAVAHGIPVLQPVKLKDPEFLEALKAWKADLFVVVAFRMLPEEVWAMPKLGTFNLHAALLPQYRGAAPINWAVINGEKMTGVTTFMIDKDIDTGGIILRQECRIRPDETAGELHDELMQIGSDLVLQTVEGIIQHNVELRVQRSFIQGSEELKPAPKLTKELCHIDWTQPTDKVYNLIRGLSPYPAAYATLRPSDGGSSPETLSLKIYRTEKRPDLHAAPGTVLSDGKTWLAIATADGALEITDLQLAGKKRMGAADFLRGFREPEKWQAA
ncbi:MAG: methionyl-tRNA formyltransferase [Bacteroidales bacterium]|nr:methionyl-tRNA formyltransferase [Bacteroidales bacterium]